MSTVRYRIERDGKGPAVRAVGVTTVNTGDLTSAPVASSVALRTWQLARIQMMDGSVLVPDSPSKYTLEPGSDGRATRTDGAILEFLPAPGPDGLLGPDERCSRSGGSVGDFPNTCLPGACGCSPESSHAVQVCQCPASQCFDGKSCTPSGKLPADQLR